MPERKSKQKVKFTIYHGFVVSIALHSALGMPFVVHDLEAPVKESSPLVVDLQGVVADRQTEQKEIRETAEQQPKPPPAPEPPPPPETSANPAPAAPQELPTKDVVEDKEAAPAPPPPKPVTRVIKTSSATAKPKPQSSILQHAPRADERQNAETIRTDPESENDRLSDYVKLLARRVQEKLVYPSDARQARLQGTAIVSFTILPSGQIRLETLQISASSGQPKLDAGALNTVRSSVPFDPPPKEITVSIAVAFGPQP